MLGLACFHLSPLISIQTLHWGRWEPFLAAPRLCVVMEYGAAFPQPGDRCLTGTQAGDPAVSLVQNREDLGVEEGSAA